MFKTREMEEMPDDKVLDLSKKNLKQLGGLIESDQIESLILDENQLCSLENINAIPSLLFLSAARNRIRRMSSLPHLVNLTTLDLSNNSIVCIEALNHVPALKHLNLSGNYIKLMEHLHHSLQLQYLDLSQNSITYINDISMLTNLKELYLQKNHVGSLRGCEKYLPRSLEILNVSENEVGDLADVCYLETLPNLIELAFRGNPCTRSDSGKPGFNYRPYLKSWCTILTSVDGIPLDPLESLKGEWLYSQGRSRRFRPGDQSALAGYLQTASPIATKTTTGDEERKLKLILQHQQQLSSDGARMSASYHDTVSRDSVCASPDLMARSLDISVLRNSPPRSSPPRNVTPPPPRSNSPLHAASTLVPVPESLISPDVCRPLHPLMLSSNRNTRSPLATPPTKIASPHSTPRARRRVCQSPAHSPKTTPTKSAKKTTTASIDRSERDESERSAAKLHTANIHIRASQKQQIGPSGHPSRHKQQAGSRSPVEAPSSELWKAALCIQRRWRGYRTRNLDAQVLTACRTIHSNRMQDYIVKVAEDLEAAKATLEGNRKLQVLQMQALQAMWRKVSTTEVDQLAQSCLHLTQQVEELRRLVHTLQTSHGVHNPAIPCSTQTDIVAVHTPQGHATFPDLSQRPSHLSLQEEPPPPESDSGVCWTPACQEGRDLQSLQEHQAGVPASSE